MSDDTDDKVRAIFDPMIAQQKAWRTLGISDTAPDPERQSALNRALHEIRFLMRAARTLANPSEKPENVLLATKIVDAVWEPISPGDRAHPPQRSAEMQLLSRVARAAEEGEEPIPPRHLAEYARQWPDVAPRIDPAVFADAVRAWSGRHPTLRKWDGAIALLQSAGLGRHTQESIIKAWERWRGSTRARLERG